MDDSIQPYPNPTDNSEWLFESHIFVAYWELG